MNCKKAKKFILRYSDKSPSRSIHRELRTHLLRCVSCSQELAAIQKLDEIVKRRTFKAPTQEYWDGFWLRLHKRLEEADQSVTARVTFREFWERLTYPLIYEPKIALGVAVNVAVVVLLVASLVMSHQHGVKVGLLRQEIAQVRQEQAIGKLLRQVETLYSKEKLDAFTACFSKDYFPDYAGFMQKVKSSFDDSNNLDLSITVTSIHIQGDEAIARITWSRRWDSASYKEGADRTIRMKKIGGWKITDVDDESAFVIGRGTLKTYIQ